VYLGSGYYYSILKNLSKNKKNYCHLLLLTESESYASKELLKFFLMASQTPIKNV